MSTTKEVVIAAFNRNYDWINQLNPSVRTTIYRKGDQELLPNEIFIENNVGRDVHTFFQHLVRRYDTLSDFTFMAQDYCFDHVSNYVEIINGDEQLWDLYSIKKLDECWFFNTEHGGILHSDKFGKPHHHHVLNIHKYWNLLFEEECPQILHWSAAGHFCVSKNQVHKRPIQFYEKIVKILENDYQTPWVVERLEHYLFDMNYEIKK